MTQNARAARLFLKLALSSCCIAGPALAAQDAKAVTTSDAPLLAATAPVGNPAPTPASRNLAKWNRGAVLIDVQPDGNLNPISVELKNKPPLAVLLGEDTASGVKLPEGAHAFIIDLGDTFPLESLLLKGFTASGEIEVLYSDVLRRADSRRWVSANPTQPAPFSAGTPARVSLASLEARYVLVRIKVAQPGEVGAFSLLGYSQFAPTPTRAAVEEPTREKTEMVPVDYAKREIGARASRVDGANADALIDGDPSTAVTLGENNTKDLLILDLGEQKDLESVSMLFQSGPGSFEVYFLNTLPEGWKATKPSSSLALPPPSRLIAANDNTLANLVVLAAISAQAEGARAVLGTKPSVVQQVQGSETRLQVNVTGTTSRYVVVRWVPASGQSQPVRVFEVSAIGHVPAKQAVAAQVRPASVAKSGQPAAEAPAAAAPTNGETAASAASLDAAAPPPADATVAAAENPPDMTFNFAEVEAPATTGTGGGGTTGGATTAAPSAGVLVPRIPPVSP